jgi:hypothetical protein
MLLGHAVEAQTGFEQGYLIGNIDSFCLELMAALYCRVRRFARLGAFKFRKQVRLFRRSTDVSPYCKRGLGMSRQLAGKFTCLASWDIWKALGLVCQSKAVEWSNFMPANQTALVLCGSCVGMAGAV